MHLETFQLIADCLVPFILGGVGFVLRTTLENTKAIAELNGKVDVILQGKKLE